MTSDRSRYVSREKRLLGTAGAFAAGLAAALLVVDDGAAAQQKKPPPGRWAKVAALNGTGAGICNSAGDRYACIALRCGKGRGLEFAFLFNLGDYGTSRTVTLAVDGERIGTLAFTAIDRKRELVAPYDAARNAPLLERLRAGSELVFDAGPKHRFSLRDTGAEIDRTLAECAGESGRAVAVVEAGQAAVAAPLPRPARRTIAAESRPAPEAASSAPHLWQPPTRRTPPLVDGKFQLVGRADQTCEAAGAVLADLRKSLGFGLAGEAKVKAGETRTFSWTTAGSRPLAPTYLMIAADGPIRVNGKGFYPLTPKAVAPFRLGQFADRTRIVVPLHVADAPARGSVDIRPLRAGEMQISAAIVGYARCGELADPAPRAVALTVTAGTPEIVVADKFELTKPDQMILSPDGTRRIDILGQRWRLIDVASGGQLSEQVGTEPRFSPTGRFVVAKAEEKFRLFDAFDGSGLRTFHEYTSGIGWSHNDSFIISAATRQDYINITYALSESEESDTGIGYDSCPGCDGFTKSAIYIDIENNYAVGKTEQRLYAISLTKSAREANKYGLIGSVESFNYVDKATIIDIDKIMNDRWIQIFIFSHLYDLHKEYIPNKHHDIARLMPVVAKARFIDGASASKSELSDPIAIAVRGIGGDRSAVEARSNRAKRLQDFRLELSEGSSFRSVPAERLLRPTGATEKFKFVDDHSITVDRSRFYMECDIEIAKGSTVISMPRPQQINLYQLIGINYKLTLFNNPCVQGSEVNFMPNVILHDSRSMRRLSAISDPYNHNEDNDNNFEFDPFSDPSTCPTMLGACGLQAQLFFDRYLVLWSRESFAAAVYDVGERKLIRSLIRLPSPELMERVSLSRDLRTLTKLDSDGGFQILDLQKSQKNAAGEFTLESVKQPVILSGRVVDDEVVVWTPEGLFDATAEGASFVSMRFPGRSGDYALGQYRPLLHRPNLLTRVLAGERLDAPQIEAFPPTISVDARPAADRIVAKVDFGQEPVAELRIYQDGRLTDTIATPDGAPWAQVDVARLPAARWIAVVAKGRSGLFSRPYTFDAGGAAKRRLHVVSVGIDKYSDPAISELAFAASDAERFVEAVRAREGTSVEIVSHALLKDEAASKEAILEQIEAAIGAAQADDTVALFIAGHGVQLAGDRFYLATSATRIADIGATALPWSELSAVLAKSKARIAVFLDTCHSGNAGTDFFATSDASSAALLDRVPSGIVIFSAAKGREASLEAKSSRGGIFTDALVRAMADGKTDLNRNGAIEASELYASVKRAVIETTGGRQTPWFARNDMVGDFVPF